MSVEPPLMRDVLNGVLNSRVDASGLFSSFPATQMTAAEQAAGVTPVNYAYVPGDIRRYGAASSTDIATPLASAVAAACAGDGSVYIPGSLTGLTCSAGVSVTAAIIIYGDAYSGSLITASADITVFSFTVAASRSRISDIYLLGPGGLVTSAGIIFTNSNNNQLVRCRVRLFNIGVLYAQGINSCYVNSIHDCIIEDNTTINIKGEGNTNELQLYNTQIGGNSQIGLKLTDSNSLGIFGGNCEGVSVCCIDLDATSELRAGHHIENFHFENNTSSAGDVRIGNTAVVDGVTIIASLFKPGAGDIAGINAVNCNGLVVLGYTQIGGYASVPFIQKTNLANELLIPAGPTGDNMVGYQANSFKPNYTDASALTWLAPTAFDAAYQDSAHFLEYMIKSGSMTAAKFYYGAMDVIRITNAGAPGAGAAAYARRMVASNGAGGTLKVGAAFFDGDVDSANGAWSFGQSASAPAIANNGTVTTANTTVARLAPAGAVTGIILQSGTQPGQKCVVINEAVAANTITFAVAGTSHVADGVTSVIAGLKSAQFYWDASTSLWYHSV